MTVQNKIEEKIRESLNPLHMELKNQSHLHEGHAGHDGSGESHFKLVVVSESFAKLDRPARHRMIYELLEDEFNSGLHALSISAYAPDERNP
jgi:BolA protein